MSLSDGMSRTLQALYGAGTSVTDGLAQWKAARGLVGGDDERAFYQGVFPGVDVTQAKYNFWRGVETLQDAVFWVDARTGLSSGGKLPNLGTGGSALDAQLGSASGADTNDPGVLAWSGVNYLYLPGVAGNYASTTNSAPLNAVTGDAEWVFRVAADTWASGTNVGLAERDNGDPNRCWRVRITATGTIQLDWYPTGSAASIIAKASTSVVPFSNGQAGWIKVTLDVDNGAAGNDVKFWTAADQATEPTVWTQLGTTVTTAGTTSLLSVVATAIGAGAAAIATPSASFYRSIFRNGIGGTTVYDMDFTRGITSGSQTTFTESSSNAATVTINRSTSGKKAVAVVRPTLLLGTDDYLEVANNALVDFNATDSFSVVAIGRQWATPGTSSHIISKGNSAGTGQRWQLRNTNATNEPQAVLSDGTNNAVPVAGATPTLGNVTSWAMVTDRLAQTVRAYANTTSTSSTSTSLVGSLSNALPVRIGSSADVLGKVWEGEFVAAAVFRRALTASDIAAIVAYYGAS